jgi:ribonuclease BN (tRNA processing enzyme)
MEFANKANVDRLVLFHHDPYHTDSELEALLAGARNNWPGLEDRVSLAYEGMTISLDEDCVTIE